MRLLVMGAGAMGSVVGGFMAKAEHDMTMIGIDPHMQTVRDKGLRISGIWGEHHIADLDARTGLDGLHRDEFDMIFITVKSYDTATAVGLIEPLVGDDTLVCSYQNGLGNAEAIAKAVGWHRTVGARVIFGVMMPEPGHVKVTVIASPTALGVYEASAPSERVRKIAEAMDAAGIPTVYTDKIATLLWQKVAYNSALNPLSAILDVPYGILAETQHARMIINGIVKELYDVGNAMGIELEPETAGAYLELLFDKLIPPTAAHYASMREDFVNARRTEIDALNGAVCRYGEQHGVACPTNLLLTRLVHAREHALGVKGM